MKLKVRANIKYVATLLSMMILTLGNYAYASSPTIVTGTQKLFKDASGWVLILDPVVAGVICGVCGLQWFFGDEGDKKAKVKIIKGTFGMAVFIEVAAALITFVLSYYATTA